MAKPLNIPDVASLVADNNDDAASYVAKIEASELSGKTKPLKIAAQAIAKVWQKLDLDNPFTAQYIDNPEAPREMTAVIIGEFANNLKKANQKIDSGVRLAKIGNEQQTLSRNMAGGSLKSSFLRDTFQSKIDRAVEGAIKDIRDDFSGLTEALDIIDVGDDSELQEALDTMTNDHNEFVSTLKAARKKGSKKSKGKRKR